MAGKPVVFHPEAAAEYEAAFDWYFERSELAASKFETELNTAVQKICDGPHRWPVYILGTRKFVLDRFPFANLSETKGAQDQILCPFLSLWAYVTQTTPEDPSWKRLPGVGLSVPQMLEGCQPPQ